MKSQKPRFAYTNGDVLVVFNYAPTTNQKVTGSNRAILQHYTFAREQFEHIRNGGSFMGILEFDAANCGDCPFSRNQGNPKGACYTHKFPQMRGFGAMLKSIAKDSWDELPQMPSEVPAELLRYADGTYIRFGSYGETIHVPLNWMADLTKAAARGGAMNHTGYTHQWHKYPEYSQYMMASIHNQFEQAIATDQGWRTFAILTKETPTIGNIVCPASAENDKGTSCDRCGLCSGTKGKSKKNVEIRQH